jgi:hypothetical protein
MGKFGVTAFARKAGSYKTSLQRFGVTAFAQVAGSNESLLEPALRANGKILTVTSSTAGNRLLHQPLAHLLDHRSLP